MLFSKIKLLHIMLSLTQTLFAHAHPYLEPLARSAKFSLSTVRDLGRSCENATIAKRMPAHSWDTHMHVTDPAYPEAPDAEYTPGLHNLTSALSFESTIGIRSIVLIQPSIYGNDNTLLLNALKKLGTNHGRGVVGFDANKITRATLEGWHKIGVRGVRLNLKSNNVKLTQVQLQTQLIQYAEIIRPLGWVLELYIGMEDIPKIEPIVPGLGVRLSIAHFGAPTLPPVANRTLPLDPYKVEGFQSLVNLLKAKTGQTYIKFSGAYRFDTDPQYRGIESIAVELLKFASHRIIFASDWPHTRFETLDIHPFVQKCLDWTDAAGATEDVFSGNAHKLWDIPSHR